MQTLHELFVHELQDMLAAERDLLSALDEMARCATDEQLQQGFAEHRRETETHVQRLRNVFDTLGIQPSDVQCEGMAGIIREHTQLLQQGQHDPQVHAVFDVGAAERAEQYEIAGYEELIRLAHALGYLEVANELRANLIDEREQLSRLESAATSMDLRGLAAQGRQQISQATSAQGAHPAGVQQTGATGGTQPVGQQTDTMTGAQTGGQQAGAMSEPQAAAQQAGATVGAQADSQRAVTAAAPQLGSQQASAPVQAQPGGQQTSPMPAGQSGQPANVTPAGQSGGRAAETARGPQQPASQ